MGGNGFGRVVLIFGIVYMIVSFILGHWWNAIGSFRGMIFIVTGAVIAIVELIWED